MHMKMTALYSALILLFIYFAALFEAGAVSPPPDGCYPNFTTAEGCDALSLLTTGAGNTAVGWSSLSSNSGGNFNTGIGGGALTLNNADSNTAVGAAALLLNTTGGWNVAIGTDALVFNDSGTFNSAVGTFSLYSNTDGLGNNAFGYEALSSNISAWDNTAIGVQALFLNDETGSGLASGNTAVGNAALLNNIDGSSNSAVGFQALSNNVTGIDNTAVGTDALDQCNDGSSNVAIGDEAGTAVVSGNNIICIGAGVAGEDVSDSTWIGNIYGVATISGTTAPVVVSDTGQLGTVVSSKRFKKDIAGMEKASEAVLSLRPVTFRYKADGKAVPQFGLIAEEVAKVNPALVLPDKEGKPYTVRYDAVNAMLLNEFLKEHKAFVEEQHRVQDQGATIARLERQVATLTAGLQKVSAQLEIMKPESQTVSR
jgi:hypothetical protein